MTLFLVRHASAGSRDSGDPNDIQRHLDDKGWRQAGSIARHLADEPISAIYSSPLPRCIETVEPLSQKLGIAIHPDTRLVEGASLEDAWAILEENGEETVVLCSHGDLIPELVERNQRRGMRTTEPIGFSKGSIWTLRGWDGTRFARGIWTRIR